MSLTHEEIWAVAGNLEAEGTEPTLAAVRKALGRGSYTTLSEAMAERRKRLFAHAPNSNDPLPPALSQLLERLGQQVWATATAHSNDRLKSDRDQFERMRNDLEAQRTEAAQVAEQATDELEEAHTLIAALQSAADRDRSEINELRQKLASASERIAASAARTEETERRIDDLNRELNRLNDANAALIRSIGDVRR